MAYEQERLLTIKNGGYDEKIVVCNKQCFYVVCHWL